jgi:hypothetical protein
MNGFRCSICGKTFERIPVDAIQIGRGSVSPLYRFANGEVHALSSTKVGRKKAAKPAEEK